MVREAQSLFNRGLNVVDGLRCHEGFQVEQSLAIEVAYELQSGTYTFSESLHKKYITSLIEQLADVLEGNQVAIERLLDVGVGEATTLVHLANKLGLASIYGVDISFSRLTYAMKRLARGSVEGQLAVANMDSLPFESNQFDLVLTVHALEPNGGREFDLLQELSRVSSKWVLLVEPDWDLAAVTQRKRMADLGYIRSLRSHFISVGLELVDAVPVLLNDRSSNLATIFLLRKAETPRSQTGHRMGVWSDPESHEPLNLLYDKTALRSASGLLYPVVAGIPFLRTKDALLALRPASL